jgi:hypothetical protein
VVEVEGWNVEQGHEWLECDVQHDESSSSWAKEGDGKMSSMHGRLGRQGESLKGG